jgi:glycosyltransferase involved in cell wall biosynthesis
LIHDNQSLSYGVLKLQDDGFTVVTTVHHPITHDLRIALEAAGGHFERLLIRRWHYFLRMQGRVIRRLRHVITVSNRSRQDIATDFGRPEQSIDLIYNGIDTEVFRPLPEIDRSKRLLIATASADAPLKGLRYLLLAYKELLGTYPDLQLLVIGRPQPGGKTEQLLDQLGLRKRVRFESGISTDELVRHYARATIAVVPSLYEGFGLPAGEAMAAGLAVVSTDGGALPEIVGEDGVIVPSGDSGALAHAIARLLDDEPERRRLGVRARERILSCFSWSVCAEQMLSYYRGVIANADR